MFPQNRKYFRFPLQCFAVLCFAISLLCRSQAVSVPKECVEVAVYAKKMTTESMTIDLGLVSNIIDCVKELHKLYQTTDWKRLQSMIPNAVRDVLRNVPNLGKKALAVAKGNTGLCFLSVYSLYRAVDMYDRAMSLEMDYKMHRKEFEWLQRELQPVIDQIHNQFLPLWEYFSTVTLRRITTEVIAKLDRFQMELKRLVRAIQSDIKKGQSDRRWVAASVFGSIPSLITSVVFGNVPGAVLSGIVGVTGLATHDALTKIIWKLESLQYDLEILCIETVEYRSLLEQKLIYATLFENFDFLIALSSLYCLHGLNLLTRKKLPVTVERDGSHQRDRQARDEYRRATQKCVQTMTRTGMGCIHKRQVEMARTGASTDETNRKMMSMQQRNRDGTISTERDEHKNGTTTRGTIIEKTGFTRTGRARKVL